MDAPQSRRPKNVSISSRFDFSSDSRDQANETGTLRELLDELYPRRLRGDAPVNLDRLAVHLAFVGEFTARKYPSLTEELPLADLRTIKLLHMENEASGTQLFRHLRSPRQGGIPTIETRIANSRDLDFPEIESSRRNQSASTALFRIRQKLALEISPERRARVDRQILDLGSILRSIELEDLEIYSILSVALRDNEELFITALSELTHHIEAYGLVRPAISRLPLPEILYTHISSLEFLHFVGEYRELFEQAQLKNPLTIQEEMLRFCNELSQSHSMPIEPSTKLVSVDTFEAFVRLHADSLRKLIELATNAPTTTKQLLSIVDLSAKILLLSVHHQYDNQSTSDIQSSTADCITALCIVRLQQFGEEKMKYGEKWIGHENSSTYILGQLNRERSVESMFRDGYVPHGTMQLLVRRFVALHAAINGETSRQVAIAEFRIARLEAFGECYESADIDAITIATQKLNENCKMFAEHIVDRFEA